ncbi:DoxX family protein [Scleromatobacter humisilvae]|uniref:DoxX family protein n=1 Tax=Scleromatobacter humisilvae TaxID=2897159 RepID=A0A9X1YQJ0_9BURK|nr:DoxX family protein [Scleromatobacter humisilvae]MCK9689740.1 DoxX family protein [Scleromatobacter humisilvae]
MTTTTTTTQNNSALPLLGRVLIATIFLVSAFGKLSAPAATQGYIASVGLPFPLLSYLGALAIELGGGLMLVLGYRTRLASLGLAVFSIISAIVFHHALGDQNQMFHFLKNIAMAGGLLQIVTFGPGAFSLDSRRLATPAVGFAI